MNEVRPTYVMGVPRTWEKIVAHMQVAVDSAGFLARFAFAIGNRGRPQACPRHLEDGSALLVRRNGLLADCGSHDPVACPAQARPDLRSGACSGRRAAATRRS